MAIVSIQSASQRVERAKRLAAKQKPQIDESAIEETSEYEVFERLPGNRPIDEAHVLNLMKAMKKKDLRTPIQINQNFEVIDGQHRLEARRRLGIPVPYFATIGYGLEEVQELNAKQKKWTNDDFVKSFIELGKVDYRTYQWFRHQFKLPHEASVMLLSGESDRSLRGKFKNGDFKVNQLDRAKEVARKFVEIEPFFPDYWNHSRFVNAVMVCLKKKNFDFKKFMAKLKANPTILKPQASLDNYLQHIEDVYNYRSVKKVPIRYGEEK
jgi:hypothetical protein